MRRITTLLGRPEGPEGLTDRRGIQVGEPESHSGEGLDADRLCQEVVDSEHALHKPIRFRRRCATVS